MKLFTTEEFDNRSKEDWIQKVTADLKGKSLEVLDWIDENNLKQEAYYDASSLQDNDELEAIQASQQQDSNWKIVQEFPNIDQALTFSDEKNLEGLDAIAIHADKTDPVSLKSLKEKIGSIDLILLGGEEFIESNEGITLYLDPIGKALEQEQEIKLDEFAAFLESSPDCKIWIDGNRIKNSGANHLQEIALILQHANEYFDRLSDLGIEANEIAKRICFKVGFGTSYLHEITKCRALRHLIRNLFHAYKCEANIELWGSSATYYQAHQDFHTNLLRLSSQCMSAAIGNCNMISLQAYDYWKGGSKQGYRLSRNIQLILKEESYLNQVNDIAAGSYHMETLTKELSDSAWDLFLQIEEKGGMIPYLNDIGFDGISNAKKDRLKAYKEGEKIMVGVNKYTMPDELASELLKDTNALSKDIKA